MNQIRFDIQHSEFGNLVIPVIDSKSLISILKEFELALLIKRNIQKLRVVTTDFQFR
jgi:hypothetical protein